MTASLSIVIPSRTRVDLLSECLASVIRNSPRNTEVIVVDDGSPRGAASAVARGFHNVQAIRLRRPSGFCVAANAGLAAARAPIVELLNDDTAVTPGWAEAALARFADPTVVAVAPLVLSWDGRRIDSAGDEYDLGGFARKRGHGMAVDSRYLVACTVDGASGSSAFYRRDAVLRVGALPESFGAYFEDVDLSLRLRNVGRIVYEPFSRVLHRGGQSYGTPSRRLIERQSCNEERLFWRNLPTHRWSQALPRHTVVLTGKAIRRWSEGTLIPWVAGRMRAITEMPTHLRHSRRTHSSAANATP